MNRFRIGIPLNQLGNSLPRAIEFARRLGGDGLSLDAVGPFAPRQLGSTGRRQLRRMLADAGLAVACLNFTTRRGYGTPQDLDRRLAATRAVMTLAYDLGCSTVSNFVGQVPNDPKCPEWQCLREALLDLGNHAQRCGAFLCARTGYESGACLANLLRSVPAGTVGVDLDPARLVLNGFSASEATTSLAEWILHVRANDADRDVAQGRGLEVPLGRGIVDFPWLSAVLEQHNYRGFVTIDRGERLPDLGEIEDAVCFLRAIRGD